MNRISNEDGSQAGSRNLGRLALGLIPLTLGLGASIWLGVWMDAHYFRAKSSQEARRGLLVSAPLPIKDPLKLTNPDRLHDPNVSIDLLEWNEGALTVRFHALHDSQNFEIHWVWISPDGTHMGQSWSKVDEFNGPWSLAAGEKGIVTVRPSNIEDRASQLEAWIVSER